MTNTNNPIVRKLAETLNARTDAALASLASLDDAILEVLADAEDAARARFHTAQSQLNDNTRERLAVFFNLLDEMARDAVGRATSDLLCLIEGLAAGLPIATTSEPTPEPEPVADLNAAFVARSREFAAVAYEARQAAEQNPEPEPTPEPVSVVQDDPEYAPVALPVAAHAVETQDVALLPEDDTDEDEEDGIDDSAILPDDGIGEMIDTTTEERGLHTRTGTGSRTRYEPVNEPDIGHVYYRKIGRKWVPVRFTHR